MIVIKKIFCFLCVLVLCSCSRAETVSAKLCGISFKAKLLCENQDYTFGVKVSENGECLITVLSPESISGLEIKFDVFGASVSFLGQEYSSSYDSLPQYGSAKCLYGIIRDVCSNERTARKNGDNLTINGETDIGEYFLHLSPSGLPISAEFPKLNILIEFNEVSLI